MEQIKYPTWIRVLLPLILTTLSLVIRLPELLDPQILDGDECLVGLMAKHQWEGKDVAPFFWGQRYGFTYLETSTISLFYSVLGYGQSAVQWAMLLLWTVGILGLYYLLVEYTRSPYRAFALTLLFAALPAWYFWSLKARGGYLTAFLLVNWLLFFWKRYGTHRNVLLLGGMLIPLIWYSQPLWVPSLVLVILASANKEQLNHKSFLFFVPSFLISYFFLRYLSHMNPDNWNPELVGTEYLWLNLQLFPERLVIFFGGNHFLGESFTLHLLTRIVAIISAAVLIFWPFFEIRRWYLKGLDKQGLFLLLAAWAPLGLIILSRVNYHPRYVLPMVGYFVLFLGYSLNCYSIKLNWKSISAVGLGFLLFMGGSILLKGEGRYRQRRKEARTIQVLTDTLVQRKHEHILCSAPELHWQIMFYSQEKVTSRYLWGWDRYEPYFEAVQQAYSKEQIPVVTFHDYFWIKPQLPFEEVAGYYVLYDYTPKILKRMYFELLPENPEWRNE